MSRMPTRDYTPRRSRLAWLELSRGASIRLGILMRQIKIKPEHIEAMKRGPAS